MIPRIQTFVFNDFGVNTYIVAAENGDCVIIDAACQTPREQATLKEYVSSKKLNPVFLITTHTHVDHVMGSAFVKQEYNIPWLLHQEGSELLKQAPMYAGMFGLSLNELPAHDRFLEDGEELSVGDLKLQVLYTPGHAPGSVCIYLPEHHIVFTGDVLFSGSIGRTDLPGGDHDLLLQSIAQKLLVLPDETVVYPGHGPATSIGAEKKENPYL